MLRIRNNLVFVALRPQPDTTASGLITAPAMPPPMTSGKVLRTGPKCYDVRKGDLVAFAPSAGVHEYEIGPHRCVFLRETDIMAILDNEESPAA